MLFIYCCFNCSVASCLPEDKLQSFIIYLCPSHQPQLLPLTYSPASILGKSLPTLCSWGPLRLDALHSYFAFNIGAQCPHHAEDTLYHDTDTLSSRSQYSTNLLLILLKRAGTAPWWEFREIARRFLVAALWRMLR